MEVAVILLAVFVNLWILVPAIALNIVGGLVIKYLDRHLIWGPRRDALLRDAEIQHQQLLEGKMIGIYGRFPPPEETRGMGIWGMDD